MWIVCFSMKKNKNKNVKLLYPAIIVSQADIDDICP